MRKRDLLERERPRLEIVPMIDIMMFLLVFFVMIVLRMIPDSGVTLSLPGASTAQDLKPTQVVIVISKDGIIHVKDQVYTTDQLQTYLTGVAGQKKTDVIVAGDKGIKLETLMDVMNTVRKSGITDIGIATKDQ
ncbi:MAG: biopolymer transporter ExbD [Rhodospirillales bacterium 20-60-12]|jgi:biopolymer transport protein ExbD|nr:MAG: biopolymer transporter ExbD [Rhodospirillales bacterium 20-60-12]HQT67675.1 biopolymer transporter ExbD [Acetobacteraceae bacterium]